MPAPRRILCIGAGPAGLYFALLAKQADPSRAAEPKGVAPSENCSTDIDTHLLRHRDGPVNRPNNPATKKCSRHH